MKKTLLIAGLCLASTTALFAQPTLTSGQLNPRPGEVYLSHSMDTTLSTTITTGPQTWNFSTLATINLDTIAYLACAATPYCDSFPGSNLASYDYQAAQYNYLDTSTTRLSIIGGYFAPDYAHITGHWDMAYYPLTLGSTHRDTFDANQNSGGLYFFHHERDSMVYDSYGTLILPGGTYTNVVRVHTFQYSHDSSTFSPVSDALVETYNWYTAGFHNPLLTYTVDTSSSSNYAGYYTRNTLGLKPIVTGINNLNVYPNPATDVLNVSFTLMSPSASATLTDMAGRNIVTIAEEQMKNGANELTISTANIAPGMYLLHLQTTDASIVRKVVIAR
jgi:hypothetical protein